MRDAGLSKKEVLLRLKTELSKDLKYRDGKILSSMCTVPHPSAKMANRLFVDGNLGDPGLFPGSVELEKEAVRSMLGLLHGPRESTGFIVSGGTEANLLAMYLARTLANIKEPEIVVPESAHFSFKKICSLLGTKMITAKVDDNQRVSPLSVKKCVTSKTVAIVANAGSAELGVIDPVSELSEIALKHNLYLHVDAAYGGLVVPFLKDLGYPVPQFDFDLTAVRSITVDPHKMGMSTIPSGGILFRNNEALDHIKTETPYLTESHQYTIIGTRPAASAAASWAVFESLGREGFKRVVKRCMQLTKFLYEGLEENGFEVFLRPTMNIIAFRCPKSKLLADKLRQNGWFVSYIPRLNCIRVVVMPHSTRRHLSDFLKC